MAARTLSGATCVWAAQIKITVPLSPATNQAFDNYRRGRREANGREASNLRQPGGDVDLTAVDGSPISVPDGLIHDWVGGVLIPGASVDKALAMFRDYAGYKKIFAPEVLDSRLLSHNGDRWTSWLRFGRHAGLVNVTFDSEYATQYRLFRGWPLDHPIPLHQNLRA